MTEPRTIQLKLQPDGVAGPAQRTVTFVTEAVATSLRALGNDGCEHEDQWNGGSLGYRFSGLELTPEERREAFKNWVLAKGFQDLARGVRETLEEALFFITMARRPSGVLTTLAKIEADMAGIRAGAAKLTFPALMEKVNVGLREPMSFDAEFQSLQNVRNCLEHRGGRVGPKDVDPGTGKLTLRFPRLKAFYMRGDEEMELQVGEVIDTQAPDNSFGGDVSIYMKRVTRACEYQLNEPVIITQRDFYEIAMACFMFAGDVSTKLPSVGEV